MKINQCVICGGDFTRHGKTCSAKCDYMVAEAAFTAAAEDFFRQMAAHGGSDRDDFSRAKEMIDQAFAQVVAERRKSFKIVE
jgi:hypothetical protein